MQLTPLKPLFTALNWLAFIGWSYILYNFLVTATDKSSSNNSSQVVDRVTPIITGLEGICCVEVLRITVGDLPGNLLLGSILHAIRFTTLFAIIPRIPSEHWTGPVILAGWAVTEVSRYPMYMFPTNDMCRSVRMVVPLVTFPVVSFSEAAGAFIVLLDPACPIWLRFILLGMLYVNVWMGPTMAFPALLKKGLPVLGLAKNSNEKRRAERPKKTN
mmetsp:Transcript_35111/g.42373  ORF Transcript_35111/g.42373 Transcript_35111/m.42373 type:complete len:216 (+) Transcript_35111:33-680(+)